MKWLVIALAAVAIYHFVFNAEQGEFDAVGKPKILLFVIDNCPPCGNALALLNAMRVDVELLKPQTDSVAAERYERHQNVGNGCVESEGIA